MGKGTRDANNKLAKIEGISLTGRQGEFFIFCQGRSLVGRKGRAALRTSAPTPDRRLPFVGTRVHDAGGWVKTLYTKHVYILS